MTGRGDTIYNAAMNRRPLRSILCLGLAAATAALSACFLKSTAEQVGGNVAHSVGRPLVARISEVGPWEDKLVARVVTERFDQRLVFDPTPDCHAVLQSETRVNFRNVGTFGRMSTPEAVCNPIGTLSLESWFTARAARGPRGQAPRAVSQYRVVGSDETRTFLRGRFPLVGVIGIPGGMDMIVAIPRSDVCAPLLDVQVAQMEFRRRGAPLVLIPQGREECPCLGVIRPQSQG